VPVNTELVDEKTLTESVMLIHKVCCCLCVGTFQFLEIQNSLNEFLFVVLLT